jgi:hypothetical protein
MSEKTKHTPGPFSYSKECRAAKKKYEDVPEPVFSGDVQEAYTDDLFEWCYEIALRQTIGTNGDKALCLRIEDPEFDLSKPGLINFICAAIRMGFISEKEITEGLKKGK